MYMAIMNDLYFWIVKQASIKRDASETIDSMQDADGICSGLLSTAKTGKKGVIISLILKNQIYDLHISNIPANDAWIASN